MASLAGARPVRQIAQPFWPKVRLLAGSALPKLPRSAVLSAQVAHEVRAKAERIHRCAQRWRERAPESRRERERAGERGRIECACALGVRHRAHEPLVAARLLRQPLRAQRGWAGSARLLYPLGCASVPMACTPQPSPRSRDLLIQPSPHSPSVIAALCPLPAAAAAARCSGPSTSG
jgi:hypothetical protein